MVIIYSTLLAIMTFVSGHFWRLRSMYVHEFRSYDLSFFTYSQLTKKDKIYRQIAGEYLSASESFRQAARCRNYSCACALWACIFCFVGWILTFIWSGCVLVYWYLILPSSFLVISFIIYWRRIGYKDSNRCLEAMCRRFPFLWPSLHPHWENIQQAIEEFRINSTNRDE